MSIQPPCNDMFRRCWQNNLGPMDLASHGLVESVHLWVSVRGEEQSGTGSLCFPVFNRQASPTEFREVSFRQHIAIHDEERAFWDRRLQYHVLVGFRTQGG